MEITTWITFIIACIIFSMAPGAGAVTTINNSVTGGMRASVKGIAGLQLGMAVYIYIIFLGLGALLASSVVFFEVVKYMGAAYLIYLGIIKLKEKTPFSTLSEEQTSSKDRKQNHLIKQGIMVNLTNPKTIVFLVAFFPQFIDTSQSLIEQYLILGLTTIAIDAMVMIGYSLLGLVIKPYFSKQKTMTWVNRFFGSAFISMGLILVQAER